jgi:hypothetical protein
MKHVFVPLFFMLAVSLPTRAEGACGSRCEYHLFNPTPNDQLRELSTDRPDKTESPYTVDPGHVQIEMDLVTYGYDKDGGTRSESWGFAIPNMKLGLLPQVDLQVIPEPYLVQRTKTASERTDERSGFGDITTRLKINMWGNDGGTTALAFMPYVKFPTNRDDLGNNAVEGGLIFPFAINTGADWGIGLMSQIDFLEKDKAEGYYAAFVQTATIGWDVTERWGAYAEIYAEETNRSQDEFVAMFDVGVTFALSDDSQLDAGMNVGLTDAAEDLNPFLGYTVRW